MIALQEVVLDVNDVERVAQFWSALLGCPWAMVYEHDWAVVDAGPLRLGLQRVPEGKESAKNRLHLDLQVDDLRGECARAQELGARAIEEVVDRADGTGFVVLLDPEGNEFCLVRDTQGRYAADVDRALAQRP